MTDALLRPSALARFWELHPRTVHEWIRAGRLPAVRTPGNHFRLRVADVRAFCEKEKMAVPPSLVSQAKRVLLVGGSEAVASAVRRALKGRAVLEHVVDPYRGLVAAATASPAVVALDARAPKFEAERAIAAIAALEQRPRVVVFDVASAARCAALVEAGATTALTSARRSELGRVLAEAT